MQLRYLLALTPSVQAVLNIFKTCPTYTHCFNCTLSSCDWDGQSCYENQIIGREQKVEDIIPSAQVCKDTLNLCDSSFSGNTTTMTFASGQAIPPSYFCIFNYTDTDHSNWNLSRSYNSIFDQVMLYKYVW